MQLIIKLKHSTYVTYLKSSVHRYNTVCTISNSITFDLLSMSNMFYSWPYLLHWAFLVRCTPCKVLVCCPSVRHPLSEYIKAQTCRVLEQYMPHHCSHNSEKKHDQIKTTQNQFMFMMHKLPFNYHIRSEMKIKTWVPNETLSV